MLVFLYAAFCTVFVTAQTTTITGQISCNKKGVSGVAVTDGKVVVTTDKNGHYRLSASNNAKQVYYSLPSGYNSPVKNGIPIFYADVDAAKKKQVINFTINKSSQSQFNHSFIVWADPQVMDMDELEMLKTVVTDVKETVTELSSAQPVHAIACGDIVFDKPALFPNYKSTIAPINIPFYQALGNHDMDYNGRSDELSIKSYTDHFGPAYYSFNVGNIHYITLKDVFYYGFSYRYIGYIDETQLKWLEQDLSGVKKGSTVIVTMHIPTMFGEDDGADSYGSLISNSLMNKDALYKILAPYNVHLLAGHSHTQWNKQVAPRILEHVHAAASGAWWQGDVSVDGSPKGYTVYNVVGDSLTWYYKGVGKNKNHQLKAYPAGTDNNYPDHIIVNVYNYDDAWKVHWYEDDKLMGEMERYWGKDPLANELYQPGKNKKHSWLSAARTYHLFKAKVMNKQSKITIRVTDRFGNIYKEVL